MIRISKFTPSQTDPEVLESVTVGVSRLQLLDDIVDRARQAESGKGRNHTLISGPRGAGKTHLVTLAHHRIGNATSLARSWLHEEAWMTLLGYRDLLRAIVEEVDSAKLGPDATAADIEAGLVAHSSRHGPVVVLVENFDQVLEALGPNGQKGLRQFMENSRSLLFVATTTAMTRDLTQQDSPFYNFFTTTKLERFDIDDAKQMLRRLADVSGNLDLDELAPSVVDARLRAVEHLAGGQPRMWSMFGQAANTRTLDELVPAFLELVDGLTPYYQQQLERRPPQQRRIIALLARADHPMNVQQIAEALDAGEKTIAAALSDLRYAGWVERIESPFAADLDQRLKYHELCEPLVRAMLQSKDVRGDMPIQIVVDFIKHWFDADELGNASTDIVRYESVAIEQLRTDGVTATALQLSGLIESTGVPRVKLLGRIDDALNSFQQGDPHPVLTLPTPIRQALEGAAPDIEGTRLKLHKWARDEYGDVRHDDMSVWEERANDIADASNSQAALRSLAEWQIAMWDFETAIATIEHLDATHPGTLGSRSSLANAYLSAGRTGEAIDLLEQVLDQRIRVSGETHPDTLTSRANLAISYWSAGRIDEATDLLEQVLDQRIRVLGETHPSTLTSRANLAISYRSAGRIDEAIELHEQALAQRIAILGETHPDTLTNRANLASFYQSAGRLDEAIELHEQALAQRIAILGETHPMTLPGRSNLANLYHTAGRTNEAIELQAQVLAQRTEVLGENHPDTRTSRDDLAAWYRLAGHFDESHRSPQR